MKNLLDASARDEVRSRLAQARPDSERQWGRMNLAQALAHCAGALEMVVGDTEVPRMFIGRIIGPVVKRLALGDDSPMRRNSPTVPAIVVSDARDLDVERQRVIELVDRFGTAGPEGCTTHPHPFFGRLTPQEWAVLSYKHLDHHLRQFGL